jgi:hypothetical protein
MSYNNENFPKYVRTAGKITIVTAITGLFIFVVAFIVDIGSQELSKVSAAGNATTTLTVLNTPPVFTLNPYEVVESSTSSPTNSGDVIQWSAIGTDANGADYFLLICNINATPTANNGNPPDCHATAVQWGVSGSTTSGTLATVSTTTEEWGTGDFEQMANWYAWVCDADPVDPRCSLTPEQGDYATSSSPFNINNRPVLTDFYNNGPQDPGLTFNFLSTSTDPDTEGGEDSIYLIVCSTNSDYSTTTNTCANDFIASTSLAFNFLQDTSATYTLPAVIRDQTYAAYGYLIDEHGHEATANGINFDFDVNNVPPVVLSGEIEIYGEGGPTSNLTVSVPAGETPSSTLNFKVTDANSCYTAASSSEITGFLISVFRSSIGSTTCDGSGTNYNPNNCYDNGVPTSTWNLQCNATTTCISPLQDEMEYTCTFPLWFVADPTDNVATTPDLFANDIWSAAVAGIDNNPANATGTMATTSNPKELESFSSLDIIDAEIVYGGIEPGDDTTTLSATSTILNVGNTGLDQDTQGEAMCKTFTPSTECQVSATSTIPDEEQQFASTTLSYIPLPGAVGPGHFRLASDSVQEIDLDVEKTIGTSTADYKQGVTYWGIRVPGSITLAGSYTGLNTFSAVTAEKEDW